MRTSNDELMDGKVFNGFDYKLQVWVENGFVLDCGHPETRKAQGCCNRHKLAGQWLASIPGAEVR